MATSNLQWQMPTKRLADLGAEAVLPMGNCPIFIYRGDGRYTVRQMQGGLVWYVSYSDGYRGAYAPLLKTTYMDRFPEVKALIRKCHPTAKVR